jgi:hypothetical protein
VPVNVAAAIVNNFYIVNTVHDIAYRYVLFLLPSLLISFFPFFTPYVFLAFVLLSTPLLVFFPLQYPFSLRRPSFVPFFVPTHGFFFLFCFFGGVSLRLIPLHQLTLTSIQLRLHRRRFQLPEQQRRTRRQRGRPHYFICSGRLRD